MAVDQMALAVYGFLPAVRRFEEAGIFFEVRCIRDRYALEGRCVKTHHDNGERDSSPGSDEVVRAELFDADDAKYEKYLMKLDSAEAKEQDHYKVLGLSKLRWEATMAEIRTAYRAKVLKHHPDKKKAKGIDMKSEEYFACITKAYEQLGITEQKRRAYDSVDKKFDESIPAANSITKDNFFSVLGPVFEMNKRWSLTQPVPLLGEPSTPRQDVEQFYNFWFEWNSWREFSYLDEEDKEKGEDRWERREMDKINKAERERRRKNESKRIRGLVELAYSKDPRVAQFKKDDQNAKERAKEEKKAAQKAKQEELERQRKSEEEAKQREKEEAERKIREEKAQERQRKQEEQRRSEEQKKRMREVAKQNNYWTDDKGLLAQMERVERICLLLPSDQLSSLCDQVEKLSIADQVHELFDSVEAERNRKVETKKEENVGKENIQKTVWTTEENQLLIKACALYPVGTTDRWQTIADYINEHKKDKSMKRKNEKEIIKQAKLVQSMGLKAAESLQAAPAGIASAGDGAEEWTATEQKALEEALRANPSSDPQRWEKIAASVGTKTKKDCIRRFKHLAEMIKKNRAQ